jgi:peptidoglycan/LPS O-acetylase OafA/YrhL
VPELESLRGIAIVLVVTYHATQILGLEARGASLPLAFVVAGHTGVSLFFVLSAFLLSAPFLAEYRHGTRVDRGRYFARRALRILPLYYVAVLAACVYTALHATDLWAALAAAAPFLWFSHWSATPMAKFSTPWWSLATEFQFYLLLPFLPFCLRTWTGRALLVGCLVTYVAFVAYLPPFTSPTGNWMYARWSEAHGIVGRAPLFALGIAAAWLVNVRGHRIQVALRSRRWMRNGGADLAFLGTLTVLGLLLQWNLRVSYLKAEVWWPHWHVLEGLLWTAIVLLVLLAPLRTKVIVANPLLGFLGLISYSLYLVHYPVLTLGGPTIARYHPGLFTPWSWSTTAVMAGLLLASVAISALTYRLIERPFLLRKTRLAPHREAALSSAA